MRTYGLSGSGMDIDQMVKDMMKARRASYDKVWQKKTQLEYKKVDYNTMYTTIRDFRNTTAFNYKLESTLMPKTVSSTDESKVSATANADAANVSHTINVTQLAEGAKLISGDSLNSTSDKTRLSSQFSLAENTSFEIKLNNKSITVNTNDSIYDFVQDINDAGIGIKANYDTTLDRFFIYSTDTGSEAKIDFAGNIGTGLTFINSNLQLDTSVIQQGSNAEFTIDDVLITSQSSNTFTISGVTYNLKAEGTANIVVSADNDKAIANVKSFIDSYNSTLEKINAELKEEKYSRYLPLTSDQKNDMKESEITEWEKRAKSGMLRRDSTLQDVVYKLRSDVSTPISGLAGDYNSLSSIGVTTGDYTEGGKLHLDETKLKKALEEDPDAIDKIFGTSGNTRESQGVAVRFYDTLKTAMDKIATVGGYSSTVDDDTKSSIARQIRSYNSELSNMNDRLQDIEDRYYKQFDAMETALSKMSQQSSWLSQQFSSN